MSTGEGEEELSKIFANRLCYDDKSDDESKKAMETDKIPSVFMSLECPFTWKYGFVLDISDIAIRIEEKIYESEGGDQELLPWNNFILNLILCFEYARTGDLVGAIEKQSLCDQILDDKIAIKGSSAVLYMGIGLRHVSLACKCHLLYVSNMLVDAQRICDNIVPFDKLPVRDQASVLGAKSAFCAEFGYRGVKESISLIQKAIDLDDSAEWFYLLGRSLGRLRRLEKRYAIPEERELQALEVSVEKTNNLSFMVLLAQSYRETSRCVFNHYIWNSESSDSNARKLKCYCDSLNQKSMEMYRKVLKKEKNNVYVLTRCALGLLKLPNPWRCMNEARNCILKAIDLAPENPMANHVAGSYFNFVNESKQAMYYFSKAAAYGVFGAELDLITAKKKKHESYNPVADLERLLHVYKEKPYKETILCYLGTYYYVKNDIKTAFKYWFEVLEADIHSEELKAHYDSVSSCNRPLNINEVIIIEILKFLDEGKLSEFEMKYYNEVINKYILYHPSLISECTEIDVSKLLNHKFEYSSWKKEGLGWKPRIPSSRNKIEIDMKSRDNFGGRNIGTNGKYKYCDGNGREVVAFRLGENQPRKYVASSLSQISAKVCTSTTSSRGIDFEMNSNANQRGKEIRIKSHPWQSSGKFHGLIHQHFSENQEEVNALMGDTSSGQKPNFYGAQRRARGRSSARGQGRVRGQGRTGNEWSRCGRGYCTDRGRI